MCTKDVLHDWNKVLFNVDYQSIRVSHCTRYAAVGQFTIFVCSSILNMYCWFFKK